jgi:hypothetical protein
METSRQAAHDVSYIRSASIGVGSIFGYVRYVFSALSVVAFGLGFNWLTRVETSGASMRGISLMFRYTLSYARYALAALFTVGFLGSMN